MPFDVLYDESFAEDPQVLRNYRVVVLPNHVVALPRVAHAQIRQFVERGGLVVADELCKVEGISNTTVFKEGEDAVTPLLQHANLPVKCETPEVLWNLLELDGATYLVVVNDKRDFGRYFGRWQKVKEKGIAQQVKLRARKELGRCVLDLTRSRPAKAQGVGDWHEVDLDLGPTGGRILMFVPAAPARLLLRTAAQVVPRGGAQKIEMTLATDSGTMAGAVPVEVTVLEPSGQKHDRSGTALLRSGKHSFTFTIPLNGERGKWQIVARERAGGNTARATFDVK